MRRSPERRAGRPRAQPARRPRRWWRRLCAALLLLVVASALPVLAYRWLPPPTTAFMLAHRLAGGEVAQQWRPIADISPALLLALVAAEDQRFPDHHGFDVDAIRSALAEHADGEHLRGASTISQQLAKNLFLWSGRTMLRKGLEAWYTLLIEALWPKRRILEVYANVVEFGDGIYGAEAAARAFFGVPAASLAPAQAALLAAVLPNPRRLDAGAPSPHLRARQAWIQRQMRQLGDAHLQGCCGVGGGGREGGRPGQRPSPRGRPAPTMRRRRRQRRFDGWDG